MNSEDFDSMSYRNMVEFYKKELRKVEEGARARDLLSERDCIHLSKWGVLKKGRLTGKARSILSALD